MNTVLEQLREGSGPLRERYLSARPFPHLALDGFLTDSLLEGLLREFPPFRAELAVSENGVPEGKMVQSDLASAGPSFRALDEILRGPDFLALLTRVTGIEGLLADPEYYGGGVHCSLPGQELDPHVDFSIHPARPWQRRVNVLLYLNPGWEEEHGGALELQSDPRDPAGCETARIPPVANRLVIFETNDRSWHGHGPIAVKARRSVAAYYYTHAEAGSRPPHYTIYADRPLAGNESRAELERALAKRRTHLARVLATEAGLLDTLSRMSLRAGAAAEAVTAGAGGALAGQIEGLDHQVKRAYDREIALRSMIDELSEQIEALQFLRDEK